MGKVFGCPKCQAVIPVSAPHCPACGKGFRVLNRRRRKMERYDFDLPSARGMAKFLALFEAAGARHTAYDHSDGFVTRHTVLVDPADEMLARLARELFYFLPKSRALLPPPPNAPPA